MPVPVVTTIGRAATASVDLVVPAGASRSVEVDDFNADTPPLLVASGSVPPGLPPDIYYGIVAESRERGVRTILDTAGQWLKEGIKAKP